MYNFFIMIKSCLLLVFFILFLTIYAQAHCGSCGTGGNKAKNKAEHTDHHDIPRETSSLSCEKSSKDCSENSSHPTPEPQKKKTSP